MQPHILTHLPKFEGFRDGFSSSFVQNHIRGSCDYERHRLQVELFLIKEDYFPIIHGMHI